MEMNSFISAMYFMSVYGCCSPIPNRRKRMNFVKAKLKKLKHRKESYNG